ncbi:adenylate/guanylate cyclase domain-containing protein [Bradyrhizobium manausense]|nr:adenylate/guanylate cyclase domain-containing protein [Bradyrhizobium manausense]
MGSMIAPRKLVAVLSADVAGYTTLMEAAEEDTHSRLMQILSEFVEPKIADHRGRIVKNTGDGFLATFDSAKAAVDCAVEIQKSVARTSATVSSPPILFRMGINLTEVIVEANDIFGDGVNLAARLQASAEPGGILLTAAVAEHVRTEKQLSLTDLGELKLKNMNRLVRAFGIAAAGRVQSPVAKLTALPDDRPSLIVLPFQLEPNSAEDAWFAEGIIEGIIHILSGIENLFVISRGTSLAYAGMAVDPRAVGRQLGVRYALSGVVQRAKGRLRVFTELSDASTGRLVRSDRRDGMLGDMFEMQDRIASEVVTAIAPAVRGRELARAMRKPPDSLTAYDLLLRALDLLYRLQPETFDRARGFLQQAMADDPGYGPAYSHAATWHMFRIGQGWSTNSAVDAEEARRCAAAALERDPNDPVALAIHGQMLSFTQRDYATALNFLDRAIAASPSCHMAWTLSSTTAGWIADGKRAVEHATRAMQLSPLDPFAFFTEHMLSQGHYINGDYQQAIAWGQRAVAHNSMLTSNLRTLAAALVAYGDLDAAREIARRILALDPNFSLMTFAARSPMSAKVLESHVPRLRAAGLPD